MKNRALVLFAALCLALISTTVWSARPLDIITPDGGEELVKGKTYIIKWNKSGYGRKQLVRLELLVGKKKKVNGLIVATTRNNGRYKWVVPSDVKFNKKTYSIRIRSVGPSGKSKHGYADISDGRFSISKSVDSEI